MYVRVRDADLLDHSTDSTSDDLDVLILYTYIVQRLCAVFHFSYITYIIDVLCCCYLLCAKGVCVFISVRLLITSVLTCDEATLAESCCLFPSVSISQICKLFLKYKGRLKKVEMILTQFNMVLDCKLKLYKQLSVFVFVT